MELDDKLCLCFHVTKRKVVNYIRTEKPKRASQLHDCYGAGTGCGWCRTFLQKLFEEQTTGSSEELPDSQAYALGRAKYVRAGQGAPPPGATPIGLESTNTTLEKPPGKSWQANSNHGTNEQAK